MTDIAANAPSAAAAPARATPLAAGMRVEAIDLLRGLVIALMALDHTRDYFHNIAFTVDPLDHTQTTPLLYLTRWITHLCAPTFVFLAGVSIFMQAAKGKDTAKLSGFLLTRGLWLVLLEVTVVGIGWTFVIQADLPPFGMPMLQVIWAIGWSMVFLSALVWLPRMAVLAIGALIVVGHNALDPISADQFGQFSILWQFLHVPGPLTIGEQPIGFQPYPVLAWTGIMALGYGLGGVFRQEQKQRDRTLLMLGLSFFAAFLALRFAQVYGDRNAWEVQPTLAQTVMDFMNITKYPPSIMYVGATLGIVLTATPFIAKLKGPAAKFLLAFGSVPLFAYVLHIYLIHALAWALALARGQDTGFIFDPIYKSFFTPEIFNGTGVPLWGVYVAWAIVLAILYPLCLWWRGVKARNRAWYMSYL